MTLQAQLSGGGRGDSEEEVDDGEDEVFGKILGTATDYEWSTLEDL